MKTCAARICRTYIGDSQDFCRRHWDMIPQSHQKHLRNALEGRQQGQDGAAAAVAKAVMECADVIANIERQSSLRSASANLRP